MNLNYTYNGEAVEPRSALPRVISHIPYGEIFVEQQSGGWQSPYLFNSKELDSETGLYYYGARYLDPSEAMWLSVDPLFEKYVGMSPYGYCAGNPVRLVDVDGKALQGDSNEDAAIQVQTMNSVLQDYEHIINGISLYFYADGNNVQCNYDNLSSLLTQINEKQKIGDISEQTANDLRDYLYGYTAAIAHPLTISCVYGIYETDFSNWDYAEASGGGVTDIIRNEDGQMIGMRCIMSMCSDGTNENIYGCTLSEIAAHEIAGHAVGGLFDIPGFRDVESIKFSNVVRRLQGRPQRGAEIPHEGDVNRIRKMAPEDRALIGSDKNWKKVVPLIQKKK